MNRTLHTNLSNDFQNDAVFGMFPLAVEASLVDKTAHRHSFFEILYISKGQGEIVCDFEKLQFRSPVLLVLSPGQSYYWSQAKGIEGVALFFSERFLSWRAPSDYIFFDPINRLPLWKVPTSHKPTVEASTMQLYQAHQEKVSKAKQASVLSDFLYQCQKMFIQRAYGDCVEDSQCVRNFISLLNEKFRSYRKVQSYCDALQVSESELLQATKRVLNKSPKQLIRERIELESKRLLLHASLSISQVSVEVGFRDKANFDKFIRKSTTLSPMALRQSLRFRSSPDGLNQSV